MATKNTAIQVSGRNIYTDKHNQIIYFDRKTKTGYLIPASEYQKLNLLQNRYVFSFILAVFLNLFLQIGILFTVFAFVVALIGFEITLKKLLRSCTQYPNFEPVNHVNSMEFLVSKGKKKLMLLAFLYLLLAILFVIYTFTSEAELYVAAIYMAAAGYGLYKGIRQIQGLIYLKNNQ